MQRNNLKQKKNQLSVDIKRQNIKKYREAKIQSKTQEEILKCKQKVAEYQRKYDK